MLLVIVRACFSGKHRLPRAQQPWLSCSVSAPYATRCPALVGYKGAGVTTGSLFVWIKGPSCADGVKNRDEVDVDCGGSCGRCAWSVSPGERDALLELYTTTGGPAWRPASGGGLSGWHNVTNTTDDPCLPTPWTGVGCATSPTRIVYVHVLVGNVGP